MQETGNIVTHSRKHTDTEVQLTVPLTRRATVSSGRFLHIAQHYADDAAAVRLADGTASGAEA